MKTNKFWNAIGYILGVAVTLAVVLGVASLIKFFILYLM